MAEKQKTLIIYLNKVKQGSRKYNAKRAIKYIKEQIKKHSRFSLEKIRLSKDINEWVWQNGSHNLPTKIEIELAEDKENMRAFLKDSKEKQAFFAAQKKETEKTKKAREEAKKTEAKKTEEEKKAEEEEKTEKAKKLEEKRIKESAAEKAEFK